MLLLKAAVSRVRAIKTFGAPRSVANHRDLVALPNLPGGEAGHCPPPGAASAARQAAPADVEITLDITPGVPHVFQAYSPILDEAAAALDRAGQLLSAHLAGAERVTA